MPTTGQFFFGTQGGGADGRVVSVNSDGTAQVVIVDNTPTVDLVTSNVSDIGLDTAAGFYFALVNGGDGSGGYLIRGSIASGGPATIVADYRGANLVDSSDDILVTSLVVDNINNRIYVGYQDPSGGAPANTGIRQYSYNPSTGAVTDQGFLVTATTSGKGLESGFNIFLPTDFEFNASTGRLFFAELLTGGASANGLWRVDVASPSTTLVQVVSQAQFPDNGSLGYIKDVEVDTSTGLLYFSTESLQPSPSAGYNAAQNAIWYISQNASSGTATKLTLTGLPGGNLFYPGDMVFDQSTRQLYVESEESDLGGGAPNDVIYVFQLDAGGTTATLVKTIVPSPTFTTDSVNIQGMAFNAVPVLAALLVNATGAVEQNATGIVLLTGAPTITEIDGNRLASATVQITGGTFSSNENSTSDDHLAVGAGLQISGLVAGTNITVSYSAAAERLTLTGYDTVANYQNVLNSIRYFATGDNPTNYGANTTRTLTWTVSDGAIGLSAGSPNGQTSTLNITGVNDAPTSTGLQGDSVTTTEPAGPGSVMPNIKIDAGGNATVSDADNLNFNSGSIRFAITAGAVNAQDRLVIDTAAATTVTVAGGVVSVGGTAIGTVAGGTGGADLVVTFNNLGNATPARVQTLIRAIDFANTGGDNPTAGARTITTTLVDGSGGTDTQTITSTVTVAALDDASIAVADPTNPVNENATVAISVLGNDTDPDTTLAAANITSINGAAATIGNAVTLASGATATINANGTITYNPNGKFNTLIDLATAAATGAVNTASLDNFTYTLVGGSTATVTVQINGVQSSDDQLAGSNLNDTITGTALGDYFDLSQFGNDTATGLGGDDAFFFGAAFTAADTVDGGAGTNDQIGLRGNYTGGNALVLGATTIANVEVLAVLPGFSYNITSNDGNVAAGQVLSIFGGNLALGENFTFNGAAETNGSFRMFGGLGNDNFTGGALDDGFYFGPGKWDNVNDIVVGGGGPNDQLALDGNYTVSIGANAGVETLILLPGPGGSPNTFNITLTDVWTAAAATKTVWGLNVTTGITINGTAEADGKLIFYGGQASDTLTGGAGADAIYGGGGGDALRGNGGADVFRYDNLTDSFGTTNATRDRILDFTAGDKIDLSRIDAITGGGDDAFTFIGNAAFSGGGASAGQLRFTDLGLGVYNVEGDVNGDGLADFAILVTAGVAYPFAATDFVL